MSDEIDKIVIQACVDKIEAMNGAHPEKHLDKTLKVLYAELASRMFGFSSMNIAELKHMVKLIKQMQSEVAANRKEGL